MRFTVSAVISDGGKHGGLVSIYLGAHRIVHTVDAPLAEIKQRSRAIVDYLNGLEPEIRELFICENCEKLILEVDWKEEGRRIFDHKTGGFRENDVIGYGYWCHPSPCDGDLEYDNLCKMGILGAEVDHQQEWSLTTVSAEYIFQSFEIYGGEGEFGLRFEDLDLESIVHYLRKGVEAGGSLDESIYNAIAQNITGGEDSDGD